MKPTNNPNETPLDKSLCWPEFDGDFNRSWHVDDGDHYCSVCRADLISPEERGHLDSYWDDPLRGNFKC